MTILLPDETQKTYSEYECIGEIDMRPAHPAIGCSVERRTEESQKRLRRPEEREVRGTL